MDALTDTSHFDALYAASEDPWQTQDSWYETRKRSLVMASLPDLHYMNAFEPACGPGELTQLLGQRCQRLIASDLHARAIAGARRRTEHLLQVELRQGAFPEDMPQERFDLVVLSELGYYFSPEAWTQAVDCLQRVLSADATIVACHWKHDFEHRRCSTAHVHQTISALSGLHQHCRHDEPDFLLDVWSFRTQSVATRERRL